MHKTADGRQKKHGMRQNTYDIRLMTEDKRHRQNTEDRRQKKNTYYRRQKT